jgi:hypothetical protein
MMKKFALICFFVCLAPSALADQWVFDPQTNCQVWSSDPVPGESVQWTGECLDGKATGTGVVQWYLDGEPYQRYEGWLQDGRMNGEGEYVWQQDNHRYIGGFSDDRMAGEGKYTWPDGSYYIGQYKDGFAHGKGRHVWPNGSEYVGEYRDGKRNGFGTMTLMRDDPGIESYGDRGEWAGDHYVAQGLWRNDGFLVACASPDDCPNPDDIESPDGCQLCSCECGTQASTLASEWAFDPETNCQVWNAAPIPGDSVRWTGKCLDGKATGKGVAQWYVDGEPSERYTGWFRHGKMHGKGEYIWQKDGDHYIGAYLDNKEHGKGKYIWPNGSYHVGEFKNGQRDGFGTMTLPRGNPGISSYKHDGKWVGGKYVVQGIWRGPFIVMTCRSPSDCAQKANR